MRSRPQRHGVRWGPDGASVRDPSTLRESRMTRSKPWHARFVHATRRARRTLTPTSYGTCSGYGAVRQVQAVVSAPPPPGHPRVRVEPVGCPTAAPCGCRCLRRSHEHPRPPCRAAPVGRWFAGAAHVPSFPPPHRRRPRASRDRRPCLERTRRIRHLSRPPIGAGPFYEVRSWYARSRGLADFIHDLHGLGVVAKVFDPSTAWMDLLTHLTQEMRRVPR